MWLRGELGLERGWRYIEKGVLPCCGFIFLLHWWRLLIVLIVYLEDQNMKQKKFELKTGQNNYILVIVRNLENLTAQRLYSITTLLSER